MRERGRGERKEEGGKRERDGGYSRRPTSTMGLRERIWIYLNFL